MWGERERLQRAGDPKALSCCYPETDFPFSRRRRKPGWSPSRTLGASAVLFSLSCRDRDASLACGG